MSKKMRGGYNRKISFPEVIEGVEIMQGLTEAIFSNVLKMKRVKVRYLLKLLNFYGK